MLKIEKIKFLIKGKREKEREKRKKRGQKTT